MEGVNFIEALERVYFRDGLTKTFNRLLFAESCITKAFVRGLDWKFAFENEWRNSEAGIRGEFYNVLGRDLPGIILSDMNSLPAQAEIFSLTELDLVPLSVVVDWLVVKREFSLDNVYKFLVTYGKSNWAAAQGVGEHYENCSRYMRSFDRD
nr:hypothetical protein [uncultured archaeon]